MYILLFSIAAHLLSSLNSRSAFLKCLEFKHKFSKVVENNRNDTDFSCIPHKNEMFGIV